MNDLGSFEQGVLPGKLTGLFIIDREDIYLRQHCFQIVHGNVHPEVHGIEHHQFGAYGQLVQNAHLQGRHQIAQHQVC